MLGSDLRDLSDAYIVVNELLLLQNQIIQEERNALHYMKNL